MKSLWIAWKDVRRNLRSGALLAMMIVVPLLVTGLMYFAFGGMAGGGGIGAVPVVVANLDAAGTLGDGASAGELLAEHLASSELEGVLRVSRAVDASEARAVVDRGDAAVGVIIPENLSVALTGAASAVEVELYRDPAAELGPSIVADVVREFVGGFNGSAIAADVTAGQLRAQGQGLDPSAAGAAAADFAAWFERNHDDGAGSLRVLEPDATEADIGELAAILPLVMVGMMIFFAFFTGAETATSIVREQEDGTLARLRRTPTSASTILGGKFLAIALTIVVQVVVLMLGASLIFGIDWGNPLPTVAAALALVVVAAGFGLLLMSFVRSSRQSGPVIGIVVTVTGMAGGLMTTGFTGLPEAFDRISLFTPQGWSLLLWERSLAGAALPEVLVPFFVTLLIGVVLFAWGVRGMRRRIA